MALGQAHFILCGTEWHWDMRISFCVGLSGTETGAFHSMWDWVTLGHAHFPQFIPISQTVSLHQCSTLTHPTITEAVYSNTNHIKGGWILQNMYFLNSIRWHKHSHFPKNLYFNKHKSHGVVTWRLNEASSLNLRPTLLKTPVQGLSTFLLCAS